MSSISVRFTHFLLFIRFSMNTNPYPRIRWSVWMDSNHRPRAYQARALTTWATDRFFSVFRFVPLPRLWDPTSSGGGDDGVRTHDPLLAGQVLSQLSYTPILTSGSFAFSRIFSDPWKLNNKSSIQAYAPTHSSFRLIRQIRENLSRSP